METTPRIPRDDFERELCRRVIEQEMQTWPAAYTATLGDEHDGVWELRLVKNPTADLWSTWIDQPMVTGMIWLTEIGSRVKVVHSVNDVENYDAPPFVPELVS